MAEPQFVYIWKYQVKPEKHAEFHAAYHPGGDWARLFSQDDAYLGTKLLRDADDEHTFMTIDHWTSRSARDAFREKHRSAFDDLDAHCEVFTENEERIGDFIVDAGLRRQES